jgi:hypothetical protein
MIIIRNITDYIIYSEDTISSALRKINKNKSRLVFLVNQRDELDGVFTDGDFRRWVVDQETIDLNGRIFEIARKDFFYMREGQSSEKIRASFSEAINLIPMVDKNNHLVAIAKGDSNSIQIGSHILSGTSSVFIIAEIGINHNGSLSSAKQLVDQAVLAGADCAKFQMRHLKEIYQN